MTLINFAPAAERNGKVILEQLQGLIQRDSRVLELGSGSGQHALLFSQYLKTVRWFPSETSEAFSALASNLKRHTEGLIEQPLIIDVGERSWPLEYRVDAILTANTLHIISWDKVEALFKGSGLYLLSGGLLITYGPFRYQGEFTSESNAQFDTWLKQRDKKSGIRDISELAEVAEKVSLKLLQDIAMPANNQLLVWQKL